MMPRTLSAMTLALLLTGCATIVNGKTQTVAFDSTPTAADLTVGGLKAVTPAKLTLDRKESYTATFTKPDFPERTVEIKRNGSWWVAGNILLGAGLGTLIGIVVDMVSGGAWTLAPDSVHMDFATGAVSAVKETAVAVARAAPDTPSQAEAAPTAPVVALATPPTSIPPPISLPLPDLREWAPGKWRSTGGTNTLWIDHKLRWSWESSAGGRFFGNGHGEIQDGTLILQGWHSRSMPMTLRLVREGDALIGELYTSRQYTIIFVRE